MKHIWCHRDLSFQFVDVNSQIEKQVCMQWAAFDPTEKMMQMKDQSYNIQQALIKDSLPENLLSNSPIILSNILNMLRLKLSIRHQLMNTV